MTTAAPYSQIPNKREQVRRVLFITLILNIVVALGKIVLGTISGALAITADGFHSLVDSSGNVAGLLATAIADRPPDANHPYGHRRFETLAALFIGAMLLLTAWEIGKGVIERLQSGESPEVTPLTFAVLVATLIINIFVSRYQIGQGRRLNSEILLADAQNTSTDVFVTLSVIISTLLVADGLVWVDLVAALAVVVLIGRAALSILRQTANVLVDTAPYTPERLEKLVHDVPGVQKVIRARSRGTVDSAQIDIDVMVAPEMTADHTEHIADEIRRRFLDNLAGVAEVEVHFAPHYTGERDYTLTARACADALGLATHEVRVIDDDQKILELHVEVPPGQTLGEAHTQVSQLEHDLQLQLPEISEVITHIEPALAVAAGMDTMNRLAQAERIRKAAMDLLREHFPEVEWHHLSVHRENGSGFALTMHATLPPQLTIEQAHEAAETAEALLRNSIHELARVTIHTEPFDH